MGHANLSNISKIFVDLLCKKESISISEVVKELVRRGETVHASEGELDDHAMLSYACEEVLGFLLMVRGTTARTPERKKTPIVEPVDITERQEKLLQAFIDGDNGDWDCGGDGTGGEYGEFDAIRWTRTPTWAKIPRNRLPLLEHHEN
jgi:hypothetical protein